MTIAVATNSALAEANAGLLQSAMSSDIEASTGNNVVGGLTIDAGSTGNIGVNLAAGVGNQQINALTIASTSTGD
jgi:outer membrane protein W